VGPYVMYKYKTENCTIQYAIKRFDKSDIEWTNTLLCRFIIFKGINLNITILLRPATYTMGLEHNKLLYINYKNYK